MNSRRLNSSNCIRSPPARAGLQDTELAAISQEITKRSYDLLAVGEAGACLRWVSTSIRANSCLLVCKPPSARATLSRRIPHITRHLRQPSMAEQSRDAIGWAQLGLLAVVAVIMIVLASRYVW